jgi:hypothetical protein
VNGATFESFLARIYVDADARAKFLADPRGEATRAGLAAQEVESVVNIDRVGLEMFAHSLRHKKAQKDHGHQKNKH